MYIADIKGVFNFVNYFTNFRIFWANILRNMV